MFRQQSGYTLIELVITLSILAMLATLAMTSYSKYSQRASISTGLALTGPIKLSISAYFMRTGKYPENNAAAGLAAADTYTNSHVRSIRVNADPVPGTITISYKGDRAISEGDTLLLIPAADAGSMRWTCTSYTLLNTLLPSNCR